MASLMVRDFPPDLSRWLASQAAAARVSQRTALIVLLEAARARGDVVAVGAGPKPEEDR